MDISPQTIRSAGFKTVKKGYDPEEVESFRSQVAQLLEAAQNQATAMEARARAAVAKLQEVSQQVANGGKEAATSATHNEDVDVISRTLLLAQRTADTAVLEAQAEADSITARARDEASRVLDNARGMAAKTIDESRAEVRRAVEDELLSAENEVQGLLARRDFLLGDVDHLEQYLQAQRERLRDAAVQLQELVDRVPGGLGDMRRPLLSASAESAPGSASLGQQEQPTASRPDAAEASPAGAVPEQAPPAESDMDEPLADPDPDPDLPPQVTSTTDDAGVISARTLSGNSDAQEIVWRMLDQEVASTQGAQTSLMLTGDTGDTGLTGDTGDTGETPTPSGVQRQSFGKGGDEAQ